MPHSHYDSLCFLLFVSRNALYPKTWLLPCLRQTGCSNNSWRIMAAPFLRISLKRNSLQLVENLRCILSLPHLLPSLARRFPFPHPLGLGLWQRCAACSWKIEGWWERKIFYSLQPTLLFKKQITKCHQRLTKTTWRAWSCAVRCKDGKLNN